MPAKEQPTKRLNIAVTGATGDLGALLLPLLTADPSVGQVFALGLNPPPASDSRKVEFRRVDLTRPEAELHLSDALAEARPDAFYHLAFMTTPVRDPGVAHELEVIGTMHVLSALSKAKVPRLIAPSLTFLYGARGAQPAVLPESAPLHGCPQSRFVSDKLQVEAQLAAFGARHPGTRVLILRLAPLLGRRLDNPATRLLRRRIVPTLLGFDPLWQGLHEEDAARALHLALTADASGPFNVVGDGVLPLSSLVHEAGARALPLPPPLARAALRALNSLGITAVPLSLLDYFHYSCVADGVRAREGLGFIPRRSVREAAASLSGSE